MKTHGYQLATSDVLDQLGCDQAVGLTSAEAGQRLVKTGANELVEQSGRTRKDIRHRRAVALWKAMARSRRRPRTNISDQEHHSP